MEKKFIRVRSVKDMVMSVLIILIGCMLVFIPEAMGIRLGGYVFIAIGILLMLFLKRAYKDIKTGEKYNMKELFFLKEKKSELLPAIASNPTAIDLSDEGRGEQLRMEVYHNKTKALVQLFEYVSYKYIPCSEMYEYKVEKVETLLK